MNRPGVFEDGRHPQTVEPGWAVMSPVDFNAKPRPGVAVGGQAVELAGAAVGAIAVRKLTALEGPLGLGHGAAPRRREFPWPSPYAWRSHPSAAGTGNRRVPSPVSLTRRAPPPSHPPWPPRPRRPRARRARTPPPPPPSPSPTPPALNPA